MDASALLPDVRDRSVEAELMDAPDVEPRAHAEALAALTRVNALSLVLRRPWRAVLRRARTLDRPVRVLDLACGGGDVAIGLARRSVRRGVAVEVDALDRSAFALEWASERAARAGVEVRFEQRDVVASALPGGYDLALCSLFLHHLEWSEATAFLRAMAGAAHEGLVQDLRRSRTGWALAWGALRVLTRSEIARTDGPRSVRAAFTVSEARVLAREAGLQGATVVRAWPQRLVLHWGSGETPRG